MLVGRWVVTEAAVFAFVIGSVGSARNHTAKSVVQANGHCIYDRVAANVICDRPDGIGVNAAVNSICDRIAVNATCDPPMEPG